MRSNVCILKKIRFRLDMRKKIFTMMVVMYYNKLTREDVNIPSMEAFKPGLEGALAT